MADIFRSSDVKRLFKRKFILIMGDSNLRALYRDLVWLLNNNAIIPISHLRRKLDFSYLGDRLLKQGELNRGRDYKEMREYSKDYFRIKFNFLTKCYTEEVENLMRDFRDKSRIPPDIILVNSCVWDITRWGPDGVNLYKENMRKLLNLFKKSLPSSTLVIFSTTLPVSPSCRGAFLVKQVEFMKHTLRFEVMEANLFARQLIPTYGYNILDFHYHFRMQIHRRVKDGVHWVPEAVRHMTNLLLTHISLSWDVALPGNFEGKLLARMKANANNMKGNTDKVVLPKSSLVKDPIMPPPRTPDKKRLRSKRRNKSCIRPDFLVPPFFENQCLNFPSYLDNFHKIGIQRVISNESMSNQPTLTFLQPYAHNPDPVFTEDNFFHDHPHVISQKYKRNQRHTSRPLPY